MKKLSRRSLALFACAISFLAVQTSADAQLVNLVTNGDFSLGTIGSAPTSWTRTGGSFYGVQSTPWTVSGGPTVTVPSSPNGGKIFVGQAYGPYNGGLNPNDTILSQTINGLVVGQNYTLSWYDAAVTTADSTGSYVWQANIGGIIQNSNVMGPYYTSPGSQWTANSMSFTATATSELLSFTAMGLTAGPTNLALDGVSITQTVPEPTSGMLVMSAAAIAALRRRRCVT